MGVKMKSKVSQEQEVQAEVQAPKAVGKAVVLSESQTMVNEAIQIHQRLEELEVPAMMKRFEEIKKHFSGVAKQMDVDAVAVFKGSIGELEFSKPATEVEISDKPALIAALGEGVFETIAKVSVTDMRKYLSQNEIDKVTTKGYGSRRLTSTRVYD